MSEQADVEAADGAAPSRVTREELDRLLRDNAVFGTLSDDARDHLLATLEPKAIPGGSVVMRQGQAADCLYLVAAGRLRAVVTHDDGTEEELSEIARGEVVGEMALIADQPRSATVYALRDTTLLRLSTEAWVELVAKHPDALRAVSTQVVRRSAPGRRVARGAKAVNVAVVPLGPEPGVVDFARRLAASMGRLTGTTRHVEHADAVAALGSVEAGAALAGWCNDLEAEHQFLVLGADVEPNDWTYACLRQADVVLLVADATSSPEPRLVERLVPQGREIPHSRSELVLVHPSWTRDPRGTSRWLAVREVDRHHHVRVDRDGDIDRVARLLLGRAIGIVYSGGGARGISEIGVLRALMEAGVPIDAVGGTSIGSIIAGGTSRGIEPDEIEALLRGVVVDGRSPVDITFPAISLAAGGRVTEQMKMAADGLDLEDGWRDFFCVSTNITRGEIEIHRRGPGWFALRSSFSVPGVFPPMRNAEGDLLVDGGVLDNMPVGVMRGIHNGISVIAVDVGSRRDVKAGDLPETGVVSGWRVLATKMNPRAARQETAGLMSILMRLTELGGGKMGDQGDLYIRPEVDGVALLDFGAFDRLLKSGYEAGARAAEAWLSGPDAPRF